MAQQEHEQAERERVLSEYGAWRLRADEAAPAAEEVRALETLLRLKAERLGIPGPGLWPAPSTHELLTEVLPRTVVQSREQLMDMVPALRRLFAFLLETGRWEEGSMGAEEVPSVLHELEFAALEAADDPTRRSFSTNILGHGLALGVDLEDEDALADYMHWYGTLPDEERLSLSDTGRLGDPSIPFDPVVARAMREAASRRESHPELVHVESSWPWFLPHLEDDGLPLGDLVEEQDTRPYAENHLVRRAETILRFVGAGRRATATGALGREDTAELLERLGLEGGARSLWDRPELAGVWVTLVDGGWLELDRSRVRAVTGPVPWAPRDEEPGDFIEFGHAVLTAALLGRDARRPDDGGFRGMPDTVAALLVACGPGGLVLPPRPTPDPPPGDLDADGDGWGRMLRVLHDIEDLADCGVLERRDGAFHGSDAVMVALIGLLRRDGAGPDGD